MHEISEMVELTDAELDAVAAGIDDITIDKINVQGNLVGIGFLAVEALTVNVG
jgi:hypothetical protein